MTARFLKVGIGPTVSLLVAFLLATACSPAGGSNPSTPKPAPAAPTSAPVQAAPTASAPAPAASAQPAAAGGEIKVTVKNRSFPEEIRVKAGAKVVFVVSNQGDENHTFELPDFKLLKEIAPGKTARIEWTVPDRKGKWDMGCFLTDPPGVHDGMTGTLVIE